MEKRDFLAILDNIERVVTIRKNNSLEAALDVRDNDPELAALFEKSAEAEEAIVEHIQKRRS